MGKTEKLILAKLKPGKQKQKGKETETARLGIWNVRSVSEKEQKLAEEMERSQIDYLGTSETKTKERGCVQINKDCEMYWSGVEKRVKQKRKVELRKKEIWTLIIIVYALTEDLSNKEEECFHETLQDTVDNGGNNIVIMGDLNGRTGHDNSNREMIMGKEEEKTKTNKGKRLIHFCVENNLIFSNTFRHKRKNTLEKKSP
ncbi:hypothetical protein ILUMI_10349 [Ignelater luminosus]|uniref:Endonuclease/exonuclease/phosphatase domain-containing protein n=1 Tax=Ignelater luminosus TaxID=2038154 RepID=A0A8K0GBJ9_IGNLU|nr:hypothetical protein ILUMI_10349 [Ignelater luminosus]